MKFQRQLVASIAFSSFSILFPGQLMAAGSNGGCSNFTPDTANGASMTVTCDTTSSYPAISNAGVITSENTTTIGNRVTVEVVNGTTFVINGSTIGLGSNAQVSNNGNLNTSSFYYGYGISVGVNGRSQAGGNIILNDVLGTITTGGTSATGIYISATNASSAGNTITNNGLITTFGSSAYGIRLNSGATGGSIANTIINSNRISTGNTGSTGILVATAGGISTVTNTSSANISTTGNSSNGVQLTAAGGTANVTNAGAISTGGAGSSGIQLVAAGGASTVTNTSGANISTTGNSSNGIQLTAAGGTANVTNAGTISTGGSGSSGIQIGSGAGAVSITNTGTISAVGANSYGIYNNGNIVNLTNSQGGTNPLTYAGILPTNYNAIVSSPTSYGKLDVSAGAVTGVMSFNVASSSTLAYNTTYATVINGLKINNLGNSYGTFTSGNNTYAWALVRRVGGSADQTDLVIKPLPQSVSPAAAPQAVLSELKVALAADSYIIAPTNYDTQSALASFGNSLQGLFAMQSAGVINGMTYDCPVFGNHNICVSAGGRYTNVSGYPDNTTSALVIGAYRFSSSLRLGGYLDQSLSQSTPGGMAQLSNGTPMVGVFGVWNQNTDGTGLEAKLAAGYASKNATLTRPVVGVSEPGSGSTALTSQGALGVLKYGFGLGNKTIISLYAGMRYVLGGMNGYAEAQSSTVSSPLTYNSISNYTTTTLAGLIGAYKLNEKTNIVASAGGEKDVNASVGNLITSGNGEFNIAMNNNYRTVRPTASLGLFYDLSPRERLGLNGIYRQEAYQAVTSTTVMATYTVGL